MAVLQLEISTKGGEVILFEPQLVAEGVHAHAVGDVRLCGGVRGAQGFLLCCECCLIEFELVLRVLECLCVCACVCVCVCVCV